VRRYDVVTNPRLRASPARRNGDANSRPDLVVENIAALLPPTISGGTRVSTKIKVVDPMKVSTKVRSKAIGRNTVQKPVVGDEANDAITIS